MHNFPKNKDVIIKHPLTKEERKDLIKLLLDADIDFDFSTKNNNDVYTNWYHENSEIRDAGEIIEEEDIVVSLEEFKAFIQGKGKYTKPFTETIELNSEYSATVTKESIKVGCQEFSHDKVKELYQLSQKALKAKI